jgi:hypothetical protein
LTCNRKNGLRNWKVHFLDNFTDTH